MPPPAAIELDAAVDAMLVRLARYLPAPTAGLPDPSIALTTLKERSVGLGGYRGIERRGVLGLVELRGVRVDATVRFELWATSFGDAATATADLATRLLADRPALFGDGVLALALENTAPPVEAQALQWLSSSEYRTLYEHRVVGTSGAESLIARIDADFTREDGGTGTAPETVTITDELVRWDDQAAPALVVRGPAGVEVLAAVSFVEGAQPSGPVTLRRTFDGATGAPVAFAALPAFLDAVAADGSPQRHAEVRFASPAAFLAELSPGGDPFELGDRAGDGTQDVYEPRVARLGPPIRLPSGGDRLEIFYEHAALDQPAVIYLRAGTAIGP